MKRKVIFTSLVLLCMMLIVGAGFATWYIKNDPIEVESTGNITAYGVIDNGVLRVEIVNSSGVVPSDSDPEYDIYNKVVFGRSTSQPLPSVDPPGTPPNVPLTTITPDWLLSNDIGDEHLTIYVKLTVTYPGVFEIDDDILDGSTSVKDTLKLFGGPDYELDIGHSSYTEGNAPTLDEPDLNDPGGKHKLHINSAGYVILKVIYEWPDLFTVTKNVSGTDYTYDNCNPFYYFNNHEKNGAIGSIYSDANTLIGKANNDVGALTSSSTYAEFAVAYLTKLHEVSQNIAFKITFTEVTS